MKTIQLKATYSLNIFDDLISHDVLVCETINDYLEDWECYTNEKDAIKRVKQINSNKYNWDNLPERIK
tara:strand:+ start:471 stop:674 length:204 start_codon:yes stop_codon:yes gene_type:complete